MSNSRNDHAPMLDLVRIFTIFFDAARSLRQHNPKLAWAAGLCGPVLLLIRFITMDVRMEQLVSRR
jgi:hypothetical protein